MATKKIIKKISSDFVLVPEAWLNRLVELSNEEGVGAQQLKGYISSAYVILFNGKRVDEKKYYEL